MREPELVEAEDAFLRLHHTDITTALVQAGSLEPRADLHPATRLWALLPDTSRRRILAIWVARQRSRRADLHARDRRAERESACTELARLQQRLRYLDQTLDAALEAVSLTVHAAGFIGLLLTVMLIVGPERDATRVVALSVAAVVAVAVAVSLLALRRAGANLHDAPALLWPLAPLALSVAIAL